MSSERVHCSRYFYSLINVGYTSNFSSVESYSCLCVIQLQKKTERMVSMAFKNLGSEGELFPQSVFIIASYGEDGTPNAMNAAWAGECSRHEICFNIGDHKTTETS